MICVHSDDKHLILVKFLLPCSHRIHSQIVFLHTSLVLFFFIPPHGAPLFEPLSLSRRTCILDLVVCVESDFYEWKLGMNEFFLSFHRSKVDFISIYAETRVSLCTLFDHLAFHLCENIHSSSFFHGIKLIYLQ